MSSPSPTTRAARPPVPWAQRPVVTYALLIAIVAIYAVTYLIDQIGDPNVANPIYQYGVLNYTQVMQHGQWYRLLSAMFIHLSLAHVFFNAYALWRFGAIIEQIFGHVHYAIIYLLSGLCGSLASLYLTKGISAGASGAIFGLIGAEMLYVLRYREVLGTAGTGALRQLLILVALNFAIDFTANNVQGGIAIDIWGHAGGFVGGILLAWLLIGSARPPLPAPPRPSAPTQVS